MSHDKFKVYHFQLKLIMAQCSCGNSKFRRYLDVDDEELAGSSVYIMWTGVASGGISQQRRRGETDICGDRVKS